MKLTLKTPPIHEPLTVEEVKAYLKLSSDEEDPFIPSLIAATRVHAENMTGRSFLKQEWVMDIKPLYPPSSPLVKSMGLALEIQLPRPPLLEVQSVKAENKDVLFSVSGNTLSLSSTFWNQDLTITYWTGFGETAEALPPDLKLAILLATRSLYEGSVEDLPLLNAYKVYELR